MSLLDTAAADAGVGALLSKPTSAGALDHFGMSYDGLNRLTSVTTTDPESFGFDASSNITSRSGPAATYAIDGANRPTGDGVNAFTWSNADRLTGRGTDTFAYDPLGRLTSATVGGASRTYTYNGDGLLASATSAATGHRGHGGRDTSTSFLFDPSRAPAPLLVIGATRLVYGLGPLYADRGTATTAFARDGLGSIRAELSAHGKVRNAFRYAAYGRLVRSLAGAPAFLGYAGEQADPTGLIYLRARWYDPGTGRFMTGDPYGGNPATPAQLNAYGYAANNPLLRTDASGHCAMVCTAIIGAAIGAVLGGASYAVQQAASGQPIDPYKLSGNIILGAATGAAMGLVLPATGFGAGAAAGAVAGLVGDAISQLANGEAFSGTELAAAIVGGAIGGLVTGGALTPLRGAAVKDALTITAANLSGAQTAFAITLAGWASGRKIK